MKSSSKASIAVVGGSGLELFPQEARLVRVGTPYGLPSPIFIGDVDGINIAFLARHGVGHTVPPHRINYRANISALNILGVERVLATNAVGSMNEQLKPGDLTVPKDFLDFTLRSKTVFDTAPVTHVDMSEPYCPELRNALIRATQRAGKRVWGKTVLACTEGPRYETPAEVANLRQLGADIVGMTSLPEAVLARELEMCYASLCYVSNLAAGMQERQTTTELSKTAEEIRPVIEQILKDTLSSLPKTRSCICAHALKDAQL